MRIIAMNQPSFGIYSYLVEGAFADDQIIELEMPAYADSDSEYLVPHMVVPEDEYVAVTDSRGETGVFKSMEKNLLGNGETARMRRVL